VPGDLGRIRPHVENLACALDNPEQSRRFRIIDIQLERILSPQGADRDRSITYRMPSYPYATATDVIGAVTKPQ
jgi:hypothetical protein